MKTTHNRKAKKITSRFDKSRDVNTNRIINTLESRICNANKFINDIQGLYYNHQLVVLKKSPKNEPILLSNMAHSGIKLERIQF
jgi:hypothetical protein